MTMKGEEKAKEEKEKKIEPRFSHFTSLYFTSLHLGRWVACVT